MDPYAGGRGSQLGMDEGKVTQFILTPTLSETKLLNATSLIIQNLLVFRLFAKIQHFEVFEELFTMT